VRHGAKLTQREPETSAGLDSVGTRRQTAVSPTRRSGRLTELKFYVPLAAK